MYDNQYYGYKNEDLDQIIKLSSVLINPSDTKELSDLYKISSLGQKVTVRFTQCCLLTMFNFDTHLCLITAHKVYFRSHTGFDIKWIVSFKSYNLGEYTEHAPENLEYIYPSSMTRSIFGKALTSTVARLIYEVYPSFFDVFYTGSPSTSKNWNLKSFGQKIFSFFKAIFLIWLGYSISGLIFKSM